MVAWVELLLLKSKKTPSAVVDGDAEGIPNQFPEQSLDDEQARRYGQDNDDDYVVR